MMAKILMIGAAALLGLIGAAVRAGEKDAAPPRTYRIEFHILEYDAEGKKSTVCQPTMVTMENRPGRCFVGQEIANGEDGKVEFLEIGTSAGVVVRPAPGGKVRVDATVESSWLEPSPKSKLRIRSNRLRVMETARLGETFREELDKDPDAGGSRVVEITVQEADKADY